jgi:hypothetical protein
LTADYFYGAVLDGPVPRFFATNPTEARAALSADPSKAYKDIQRIYARLFITENIPACDAWAFVGNPRKDNMKLFKKKKLIIATFSISRASVKAKSIRYPCTGRRILSSRTKRGPTQHLTNQRIQADPHQRKTNRPGSDHAPEIQPQ